MALGAHHTRGLRQGRKQASQALVRHVPPGVAAQLNERYDPADPDAHLDVFYPSELEKGERALTTVVWVHGAAGSREARTRLRTT